MNHVIRPVADAHVACSCTTVSRPPLNISPWPVCSVVHDNQMASGGRNASTATHWRSRGADATNATAPNSMANTNPTPCTMQAPRFASRIPSSGQRSSRTAAQRPNAALARMKPYENT